GARLRGGDPGGVADQVGDAHPATRPDSPLRWEGASRCRRRAQVTCTFWERGTLTRRPFGLYLAYARNDRRLPGRRLPGRCGRARGGPGPFPRGPPAVQRGARQRARRGPRARPPRRHPPRAPPVVGREGAVAGDAARRAPGPRPRAPARGLTPPTAPRLR